MTKIIEASRTIDRIDDQIISTREYFHHRFNNNEKEKNVRFLFFCCHFQSMVDQLSLPQSTQINGIQRDDSTRKRPMIKTYSFTTDDDDQLLKQNSSTKTKEKLPSIERKSSTNERKILPKRFSLKSLIFFSIFVVIISMLIIHHDRWMSRLIRSRHSTKSPLVVEATETKEKIIEIDQKKKNSTENRRKKSDDRSLVVQQSNLEEKKSSYRTISHRTKDLNSTKIRPNVILLKSEDFIEDLRKELKIRCEDRQIFAQLMKISGLNKDQLTKFIYQKNYQILHLQSFLSLLDYFHLMMLILPK